MKINLAILAGGFGSRLKEITKKKPKPLIDINGRPFIKYILLYLIINNINQIYILTRYKKLLFKKKLNISFSNIKIKCISEKKPMGTGGALFNLKKFKTDFLILNGDSFPLFNIPKFLKLKKNKILLVKNKTYKSNNQLNNLELNKQKVILKKKSIYMNGGVYYLRRNLINKIPQKKISLENEIIFPLIEKNMLCGFKSNKDFIDIGIKKNLIQAPKILNKVIPIKAVLFDRDGTLNKDFGYVHKYSNFKWLKGSVEAIKLLNYLGIKVIIITNQSGIGRGYYSKKDFLILNKKINLYLKKHHAKIDDIYYSDVDPEANYNLSKKLFDRKPNPGMILKCMKKYNLDKKNCFFVGNSISDKKAAKNAGITFYHKENYSLLDQIKQNIKHFLKI